MTNNTLAFWSGHCIKSGATFPTILSQPRLPVETVVVRIEKDITPQKTIKKSSKEDITKFLQTPNKLCSKKRRKIIKCKQKTIIEEISLRKATICSLNSSDKKELPVPIPATKKSDPKAKNIDIAIISANAYWAAYHLKKAQVFTLLIRYIYYQAEKEAIADINSKSVVS